MTIIDLLNKIANGEETPTFRINDDRYRYFMKQGFLYQQKYNYEPEIVEWQLYKQWLNKEIEIIEEVEPIEHLQGSCDTTTSEICRFNNIEVKVNEIIDKVNELEEGE